MKIAQVAPLYESVPPKLYGGTERVVSFLTEELVRQGHEVTLFASGDSVTRAHLMPMYPVALRLGKNCQDHMAPHVLMLDDVFRQKDEFDILHFHIEYLHFPLSRREKVAGVTTLHGRLDLPDLHPLYNRFAELPVVSISNAQRRPLPTINWQGTVYHGLPEDRYCPGQGKGGYLAFLGRICPEKGIEDAIEIAKRSGIKLKIVAKVDPCDLSYFENVVKRLLADPLVEYLGEIGYPQKVDFLGSASALLFPINWPEPFGLVMIEAMACGTPVVAYPRGSVPEIIEDGVTGVLVHDPTEAAKVLTRGLEIDRMGCRRRFEQRFGARRMARNYLDIYQRLICQNAELREPLVIEDVPSARAVP